MRILITILFSLLAQLSFSQQAMFHMHNKATATVTTGGGGGTGTALSYPNFVESPTGTWTAGSSAYSVGQVSGVNAALVGDGTYEMDITGNSNNIYAIIGWATTATPTTYNEFPYSIYTDGSTIQYNINGGLNNTGVSITGVTKIRMRRASGTIYIDKYSGGAWVNVPVYTFASTTTATLYFKIHFGGGNGYYLVNPKATGL
jgi:hypothetical protein